MLFAPLYRILLGGVFSEKATSININEKLNIHSMLRISLISRNERFTKGVSEQNCDVTQYPRSDKIFPITVSMIQIIRCRAPIVKIEESKHFPIQAKENSRERMPSIWFNSRGTLKMIRYFILFVFAIYAQFPIICDVTTCVRNCTCFMCRKMCYRCSIIGIV